MRHLWSALSQGQQALFVSLNNLKLQQKLKFKNRNKKLQKKLQKLFKI